MMYGTLEKLQQRNLLRDDFVSTRERRSLNEAIENIQQGRSYRLTLDRSRHSIQEYINYRTNQ